MVQRRAATCRYTTNGFHNTSSVNDMLNYSLNWPTLQQRRLRTRLIFFYKIIHNIVAIYPSNLLIPQDTRTRHFNPSGFKHVQTHKDTYKYSFFPCIITQQNRLPPNITNTHYTQRAGNDFCSSINLLKPFPSQHLMLSFLLFSFFFY